MSIIEFDSLTNSVFWKTFQGPLNLSLVQDLPGNGNLKPWAQGNGFDVMMSNGSLSSICSKTFGIILYLSQKWADYDLP